jgi:hypothetical protein
MVWGNTTSSGRDKVNSGAPASIGSAAYRGIKWHRAVLSAMPSRRCGPGRPRKPAQRHQRPEQKRSQAVTRSFTRKRHLNLCGDSHEQTNFHRSTSQRLHRLGRIRRGGTDFGHRLSRFRKERDDERYPAVRGRADWATEDSETASSATSRQQFAP